MFTYHYRIFDRYEREVVSLAVLGDEQPTWRPQEYRYGRWGCEIWLRFPIAKLLDYSWEALEGSENPFAVVIMAHRKTQDTTQDAQGRLRWKLHLVKGLYEHGYSRQDILELFRLLDWMMRLPEQLELTFRDEIRQFEEEKHMPYISSIERLGREEGLQEGRLEGRLEEREEITRALLIGRFGVIDEDLAAVVERLTQMPVAEFGNALSTLSSMTREELLTRFGRNSIH